MGKKIIFSDNKRINCDHISEISEIFEIKCGIRKLLGFTIAFKDSKIINIIREYTSENRQQNEKELNELHSDLMKSINN